MSQENLEIVQAAYHAISEADKRALRGLISRDITLKSGLLDDRPYRGHHGVAAWAETLRESWSGPLQPQADAFIEHGDRVVVLARSRVPGTETGIAIHLPIAHVWKIRRRKVARFDSYRSFQEALEAAGLRE